MNEYEIETVKISDGKGDYIIINASEFDEKTQTLYVEPKAKKAAKDEAADA